MRNIKLTIEYEGTNYSGWQVQVGQGAEKSRRQSVRVSKCQRTTIQEILEKTLGQRLQEKIKVIGSGRTDAGVHALGQIANFKTRSKQDCQSIQKGLNSILPQDVRIKQLKDTHPDFHSRFSSRSKLYRYTIINHSFASPFLHRHSYLVRYHLDVKRMRQAAQYLLGRHNFRSFQTADKKARSPARPGNRQAGGPVRTIRRLDIHRDHTLIYLDIEADGFLYRMVRNIVGTLTEVGRGRIKPQEVNRILKAKNRIYAGPCAPAKGLCLMEVKYKRG